MNRSIGLDSILVHTDEVYHFKAPSKLKVLDYRLGSMGGLLLGDNNGFLKISLNNAKE